MTKFVTEDNREIEVRIDKPPENIKFTAHKGVCHYCGGIVKMIRDLNTCKLQINNCRCLLCGQPYFVTLDPQETIETWELNQWIQKEAEETMSSKE